MYCQSGPYKTLGVLGIPHLKNTLHLDLHKIA